MPIYVIYYSVLKNRFGIPYGEIVEDLQERTMKNAMVIDILGNVAVFADLHPISIAAIQDKVGDDKVLLAISEYQQGRAQDDGNRVNLEFSPNAYLRTIGTEAQDILGKLASLELDDNKSKLFKRSRHLLPALWYSEIAFVPTGLYFREGDYHRRYAETRDYVVQTLHDRHTQFHREFNAKIRSHLSDQGYDLSQMPKPELDDERRQRELESISPELTRLFALAQTMQIADLPSSQFAITVAKAYNSH